MYYKNILTMVTAMAMAADVYAASVHRHRDLHKEIRNLEARHGRHKHIKVMTAYETVTVYVNEDGEVKTVNGDSFFANERPESTATAAASSSAPSAEAASVAAPSVAVEAASPVETPAETPVEAPAAQETPETQQQAVQQNAEQPAASQAATTAADTSSSNSGTAASGAKRGFAYNDANLVNGFASSGGQKCSWAYNWDSSHNGLTAPVNFVPMLWGTINGHPDRWVKNAPEMLAQGADHLLSFNEPDHPEQSYMSAADAAVAHVKYMNPYGNQARIGSPAITNSNIQGQGLDWLQEFVNQCQGTGCQIDFCVTHWYSPASAIETLFSHIEQVHNICGGKPVWITEFAPFGSDEEVASFLEQAIPRLESLGYVERYSYFMMKVGILMSSDTAPSTYGAKYFDL